jgi:hypothetical protein
VITIEEAQIIINEIKQVCEKYHVSLVGSCSSEGIYGEIEIMSNERMTDADICHADNMCYPDYSDRVCVNGIGGGQ